MRFLSIIYLIMAWDVAVRRGDRTQLLRGRSAGPLACPSRRARPLACASRSARPPAHPSRSARLRNCRNLT